MYMYPDNLKGKPILWLWYLKDIGIIGVGAIISVVCLSQFDLYIPIVLVLCYAFMTIRFQDTSIFDFIQYACAFFIYQQQLYCWGFVSVKIEDRQKKKKRRWEVW